MNIELLVVGKTDSKEVEALVELYARRVNRYCRFAVTALPDVRNTRSLTQNQQRTAEGEAILRQLAVKGLALEINTSGLRQKIGETLPGKKFLTRYRELGGELLTIGSDAHLPGDLGAGVEQLHVLLDGVLDAAFGLGLGAAALDHAGTQRRVAGMLVGAHLHERDRLAGLREQHRRSHSATAGAHDHHVVGLLGTHLVGDACGLGVPGLLGVGGCGGLVG